MRRSQDSNFLFGRPLGATPILVHRRPLEPDPPAPPCGRHTWMALWKDNLG